MQCDIEQGQQMLSHLMSQIVNILGCGLCGLCHCSGHATQISKETNGCGRVPVKFHLWTRVIFTYHKIILFFGFFATI